MVPRLDAATGPVASWPVRTARQPNEPEKARRYPGLTDGRDAQLRGTSAPQIDGEDLFAIASAEGPKGGEIDFAVLGSGWAIFPS
jgi:hypothetical protein